MYLTIGTIIGAVIIAVLVARGKMIVALVNAIFYRILIVGSYLISIEYINNMYMVEKQNNISTTVGL